MRGTRIKLKGLKGASALGLVIAGLALWGYSSGVMKSSPPGKDALNVTALTSTGGFTPTVPGGSNQWFYAYCLPSGGSLNDTLPIQFSVQDTNGTNPQSYTISLSANGSPAITATLPSDFNLSDSGNTVTENIPVSSGVLPDGNYALNIQVKSTANELNIAHDTIHIQVSVGAACNATSGNCFLTDSDFNFLTTCGGANATSDSGGTFAIVQNHKGRVVSTNPGQFYYNLIWTNTGATQAVTINLTQVNLVPQGANAVHALTFNTAGFTQDDSSFDMVNNDGTPCGPSGPCTITVNSGDTLWVTWHLTYSQVGSPASGLETQGSVCPTTSSVAACSGANAVSATGVLTLSNGTVVDTCTASACGYLKE